MRCLIPSSSARPMPAFLVLDRRETARCEPCRPGLKGVLTPARRVLTTGPLRRLLTGAAAIVLALDCVTG
jgi:hypothetical protein